MKINRGACSCAICASLIALGLDAVYAYPGEHESSRSHAGQAVAIIAPLPPAGGTMSSMSWVRKPG